MSEPLVAAPIVPRAGDTRGRVHAVGLRTDDGQAADDRNLGRAAPEGVAAPPGTHESRSAVIMTE